MPNVGPLEILVLLFLIGVVVAVVLVAVMVGRQRSPSTPVASTAGWFPDPEVTDQMRWWDGAAWTDGVSRPGENPVDPLAPTPPERGAR